MNVILLLLLCFFTGIVVKFSDYLEDKKGKKSHILIRIFYGIVYGVILFYTMYKFNFIIPLWMGIIFGLIFSRKIDAPAHYAGVLVSFTLFFIFKLSFQSVLLLFLFTGLCIMEEWLNDFADKLKNNKIRKIVSVRPILEISALLVGIFSGNIFIWLALLFHDIGYVTIASVFEK